MSAVSRLLDLMPRLVREPEPPPPPPAPEPAVQQPAATPPADRFVADAGAPANLTGETPSAPAETELSAGAVEWSADNLEERQRALYDVVTGERPPLDMYGGPSTDEEFFEVTGNLPLLAADKRRILAEVVRNDPGTLFRDDIPLPTEDVVDTDGYGLDAEQRTELMRELAVAWEEGAITTEELAAAARDHEEGPTDVVTQLMLGRPETDALLQELGQSLWQSEDPQDRTAAALVFSQSPEALDTYLPAPEDRLEAFRLVSAHLNSDAVTQSSASPDPETRERMLAAVYEGAQVLFEHAGPELLAQVSENQAAPEDLQALTGFLAATLYNPDFPGDRAALEQRVNGVLDGFVHQYLDPAVAGDPAQTEYAHRIGRVLAALDGGGQLAFEQYADSESERAAANDAFRAVAVQFLTASAMAAGTFFGGPAGGPVASTVTNAIARQLFGETAELSPEELEARYQEAFGEAAGQVNIGGGGDLLTELQNTLAAQATALRQVGEDLPPGADHDAVVDQAQSLDIISGALADGYGQYGHYVD